MQRRGLSRRGSGLAFCSTACLPLRSAIRMPRQFRFSGRAHAPYTVVLVRALLSEIAAVTRATNPHFGPMLDVVLVLVTLLLLSRRVVVDLPGGRAVRLLWSGDRARGCLPALGPAGVVAIQAERPPRRETRPADAAAPA